MFFFPNKSELSSIDSQYLLRFIGPTLCGGELSKDIVIFIKDI